MEHALTTTHATRTGRRALLALCAAGLLSGAPALAAEMSDVEIAPDTAPPAAMADPAAPGEPVTAMADPAAAMAAPEAAPGATAMAGHPAPAFGPAIVDALNAYYRGDYHGAADRLNAAAATDPTDPAAPYFLGYTYYRMGDFAKARTAFAQAYRVDPHFSPEPPASK